jgi:hypothetical protein
MKVIINWACSQSVKNVHSFLKFVNFYCRFIRNYSKLTFSLTALTKKNMIFRWTDKKDTVFERMKKMFTSVSVLMQFNLNHKTLIETDLFKYVISDLLQQYNDNDFLYLCVFFFWKNKSVKCNYKIYNKKLLVIVKCLKKWSSKLHSVKKFKILTDHKNLKYFIITHKLIECQMK